MAVFLWARDPSPLNANPTTQLASVKEAEWRVVKLTEHLSKAIGKDQLLPNKEGFQDLQSEVAKPCTRDPEPGAPNPKTRNPEPGTRNPKARTRNLEPGTRNHKHCQNPKYQFRNTETRCARTRRGTRTPV